MWEIGKVTLFLHRGINTVHEFSRTRNTVCVHVMCTIVTMNTVCKGLKIHSEIDVFIYLFIYLFIIYLILAFITYKWIINNLANTVIVKITTKFSIAKLSQPDTLI